MTNGRRISGSTATIQLQMTLLFVPARFRTVYIDARIAVAGIDAPWTVRHPPKPKRPRPSTGRSNRALNAGNAK